MTLEDINIATSTGIGLLATGFIWVLRTVFTNNKRLSILESEMKLRTAAREKAEAATLAGLQELNHNLAGLDRKLARMEGQNDAKR